NHVDIRFAEAPLQLSAFVRWPRRRFLFFLRADADLFQEWLDRLFPAEEFLDGNVDITRIAPPVNFAAQSHAGLFIEIAIPRFFKNGRHISSVRIGPCVAAVTSVVTLKMSKIQNERRPW